MSSETNISTCPHCGQILIGAAECDCWQAHQARRIAEQTKKAERAIEDMFGDKCARQGYIPVEAEHIDLMNDIVSLIANEKINTVTLSLPCGTKAKLTCGAKNVIKVERSETKKTSTEVV